MHALIELGLSPVLAGGQGVPVDGGLSFTSALA